MITTWSVPADLWVGETVGIVGASPNLSESDLDKVRGYPCIAANRAILRAPWAEILVSIDGNWPDIEYSGRRVVGAESAIDALYVPMPHERVEIGPAHIVELRNNSIAAMRIAARGGAKKLVIVGVDPGGYDARDHGGTVTVLAILFPAVLSELRAQGIEIEHLQTESSGNLTGADETAAESAAHRVAGSRHPRKGSA